VVLTKGSTSPCPISRVSQQEIRDYQLNRDISDRTRHNLRTTLTTLFNFARNECYLPTDYKGVERPTKRLRLKLAIKVFTLEEMSKLLATAKDDQLVALAVMGFAGIRAEELKRLQWGHFDFNEKHIIVPDTIAKCEERRIVPISENLCFGLHRYQKASDPVCPYRNLAIVFAHLAKRAGRLWKRKGLRHSEISWGRRKRLTYSRRVRKVPGRGGESNRDIRVADSEND